MLSRDLLEMSRCDRRRAHGGGILDFRRRGAGSKFKETFGAVPTVILPTRGTMVRGWIADLSDPPGPIIILSESLELLWQSP